MYIYKSHRVILSSLISLISLIALTLGLSSCGFHLINYNASKHRLPSLYIQNNNTDNSNDGDNHTNNSNDIFLNAFTEAYNAQNGIILSDSKSSEYTLSILSTNFDTPTFNTATPYASIQNIKYYVTFALKIYNKKTQHYKIINQQTLRIQKNLYINSVQQLSNNNLIARTKTDIQKTLIQTLISRILRIDDTYKKEQTQIRRSDNT